MLNLIKSKFKSNRLYKMPAKYKGRRTYRTKARKKHAAQTIQAAYRNRKNFRKNLQPYVETKSFQSLLDTPVSLSSNDKFTIITPDPYLFQVQGIKDFMMVGDSIYGRYLTTKMEISFPQPPTLRRASQPLWVYQLWITAGMNATAFTTPSRATVTANNLETHIANACKEFFNTKNDILEFHEKMQNVKIILSRKIVPKRNDQIGLTATQQVGGVDSGLITHESGTVEPVYLRFDWHVKTKLHYEESAYLDRTGPESNAYTHYMNIPPKQGYPVLVIYNPYAGEPHPNTTGNPGTGYEPLVRHNSKFWYGDQ